jgi:hypothetical protein
VPEIPDGLKFKEGPVKRFLGAQAVAKMKFRRVSGNPSHFQDDLIEVAKNPVVKEFRITSGWASETEEAFMNVIEVLGENYKAAELLWSSYEGKLRNFRSMVKNDIAALDASSKAAREAVGRIKEAHERVIATMTSEEMTKAIDNAERLASALERISGLKSHKLTLAVIDSLGTN